MKKLVLSLSLSLSVFALFSGCSKENEKFCWDCETIMVQKATGISPQTTKTNSEFCGITESEARGMEQAASSETTSTSGGIKVNVTITMKCTKK